MKDEGWAGRLSKWSGVVQSGVLAEFGKKTQHRWWFSSPIENVGRKEKCLEWRFSHKNQWKTEKTSRGLLVDYDE